MVNQITHILQICKNRKVTKVKDILPPYHRYEVYTLDIKE